MLDGLVSWMGKKSGWAWELISSYGLADFLGHEERQRGVGSGFLDLWLFLNLWVESLHSTGTWLSRTFVIRREVFPQIRKRPQILGLVAVQVNGGRSLVSGTGLKPSFFAEQGVGGDAGAGV